MKSREVPNLKNHTKLFCIAGAAALPLFLLAAVMLAACLSGCGTEVKAKGQMIGGVSMGRGL